MDCVTGYVNQNSPWDHDRCANDLVPSQGAPGLQGRIEEAKQLVNKYKTDLGEE